MHANPYPPVETATDQVARLALPLGATDLMVSTGPNGIVDARDPGDKRTRQAIALVDGEPWRAWRWAGSAPGAPGEIEPMALAGRLDAATRRVINAPQGAVPEKARR